MLPTLVAIIVLLVIAGSYYLLAEKQRQDRKKRMDEAFKEVVKHLDRLNETDKSDH